MARFFFELYDGTRADIDSEGLEFQSIEEVRKEAQRLLPEIAYHEIPADGDHKSYVVLVRDQRGRPVYSATLTYAGLQLAPNAAALRASFSVVSNSRE